MKKLYILVLMLIITPFVIAFSVQAQEVRYYPMEITQGYRYNLTTGLYEEDIAFAVTSKILMKSTTLRVSSDTFTYLYLYTESNTYMGFYSSQYTVSTVEDLPTWLGVIGTGAILLPAGASKVAFAVQTSSFNKYIDTDLAALNNHSLRHVFDTNDLFNYSIIQIEDMIGSQTPTYNIIDYGSSKLVQITTSGTYEWGIHIATDMGLDTHSYYMRLQYTIPITPYVNNKVYLTDRNTNHVLIEDVGNVGASTIVASTINPSFNALDYWIRVQISVTSNLNIYLLNRQSSLINLSQLGIASLSTSQLTDYFDNYLVGLEYDNDDILSLISFELVSPYYYVEDIAEEDDLSPESLIDKLLTRVNLNYAMAKTIIAVVVILIVVFILALSKIPSIIVISIAFLLYVMFTFMGWVEPWLNILFGIVVIVLIYFKLRSGGSNDGD